MKKLKASEERKINEEIKRRKSVLLERNKENPWITLGVYYGFPTCCIISFCKLFHITDPKMRDQQNAGEGTGFVPCKMHTKLILAGKITLESLIKNRICETTFPGGNTETHEILRNIRTAVRKRSPSSMEKG